MSDPIRLRASSVAELLDCALRWKKKHLDGMRLPITPPAMIGTAVHASTAAYDQSTIDGAGLSIDDTAGIAIDSLKQPEEEVNWAGVAAAKAEETALRVHVAYCREIAPTQDYVLVEHTLAPLQVAMENGVVFELTGTLDRVRRDFNGNTGVADVKTGAAAVAPDGLVAVGKHMPQLGTYTLLAEQEFGPMTLPAGIIGLGTGSTARVGFREILGAKEALIGADMEPGILHHVAQYFQTGLFPPNPASWLRSPKSARTTASVPSTVKGAVAMSAEIKTIADIQKGKQIAPAGLKPNLVSMFSDPDAFAFGQRVGAMLASSMLVPKDYQGSGPQSIANCLLALNMANRIGCDPIMVMQNLYLVHGRPAWSGQFVIAAINQSGRFAEPLHFEEVGTRPEPGQKPSDDWGFRAEAITKNGTLIKGPTVTIGMARAEGWYDKNPKWRNMPEVMLRYRAGSLFGKTECPELLMGYQTDEERVDTLDVNPETGEVLNRPLRTITPAQAGGTTVVDMSANLKGVGATGETLDDDLPMPGGTPEQEAQAAQLNAQGFYAKKGENGVRYFNLHGEIWNPEIHATSTETGGPIINSDGHYRAPRGVSPAQIKAAQAAQPSSEGSSVTTESVPQEAGSEGGYDLD